MSLQIVGTKRPIADAKLKVTGQKQYVADMKLPGMIYGKLLLSEVAHAKIFKIDTSMAEALPGVRAVVTYKNAPSVAYNSAKRLIDHDVICSERIFDDTVRFIGDRVAAVAADTEEIAAKALLLIKVEYQKLPIITTITDAIKEDAYPIHKGGNVIANLQVGEADLEPAFAACDYVMEASYTTPAIHHAAMETHAAIADWNAMDKLTIYSPNQNSFAFRVILSDIFGLTYNKIRVVSPAIGGAFGGKLEVTIEPVAAILSKYAKRPVKLVLSRKETILASRVRHASLNYVKTGFMKDGTIRAVDFKIYLNTGAYASSAMNVAGALTHKVFMAYKIKSMHILAIPVYTNTITAGAMRGYGSPQVFFGLERQMNKIARFLKMDPAALQQKNMVDPDSLNPNTNQAIGNPRPKDCLELAMHKVDYEHAVKEQRDSQEQNKRYRIGVGVALGVHGNNCYGAHRDNTSPMIKMNEDGSCILYTGAHEMGNDVLGMQEQIVSEVLGITSDRIDVVAADTDACLWHIGDYSSRGVFVIGAAVKQVAEKMKKELLTEAANVLEVAEEEIALRENTAWVTSGSAKCASLREVMMHCQSVSKRELCVFDTYQAPRGATSYGVHIAKVLVDTQTGITKILNYVAVHDVGFVINPLMIEGQLEGGIHMGLGFALSEEITFDDKGQPAPLLLKKYGILKATQMPQTICTGFIAGKGGEPKGPYGAKALGECPVVPVAPAVVNAICNALEVELDELPVSEERIREKLKLE
ncbi:MAG: xanthine dehydrogenase family protein molybdopterin-binding subunit [Velocimicrobium sp.]